MTACENLLTVEHLSIALPAGRGRALQPLVHDVGFSVGRGEVTGIVGETGSGKTLSMLSVLGLLPAGARVAGTIAFDGLVLEPGGADRGPLLGRRMAMVFQDARSALHPTCSIGRQLRWAIRRRRPDAKRRACDERAKELLRRVGLKGSDAELAAYPFEFSGGMCQRAAIAIALAREPELLFADEPTSALDPTIGLQIADLLDELVHADDLSCLVVTHDIRLARYLCDEIVVFRDGRVVESGGTEAVVAAPADDYTRLLLGAAL